MSLWQPRVPKGAAKGQQGSPSPLSLPAVTRLQSAKGKFYSIYARFIIVINNNKSQRQEVDLGSRKGCGGWGNSSLFSPGEGVRCEETQLCQGNKTPGDDVGGCRGAGQGGWGALPPHPLLWISPLLTWPFAPTAPVDPFWMFFIPNIWISKCFWMALAALPSEVVMAGEAPAATSSRGVFCSEQAAAPRVCVTPRVTSPVPLETPEEGVRETCMKTRLFW